MERRMLGVALVALMALAGLAGVAAQSPSPAPSPPPSCGNDSCPPPCPPGETCPRPCPEGESCPQPCPEGETCPCPEGESCPPRCTPERPCPECAPDTPCSDPAYRECMHEAREDGNVTHEQERACRAQYCATHESPACPQRCDGPCPRHPAQECQRHQSPQERERCVREWCKDHKEACKAHCRENPRSALCGVKPKGDERHITFEPVVDGFANLRVHGNLVLTSVRMVDGGEFETKRQENRVVVRAGDSRLVLHDEANAFLRFEGPDATVTLVFPEGVRLEETRTGVRIQYPGGALGLLDSRDLEWLDDRTVEAQEFFSFHIAPPRDKPQPPGAANPLVREKIKQAVAEGALVGAEVRVHNGGGRAEVFAYDRVNVTLRAPLGGAPTPADPLRVVVSAELPQGRTIVLHINKTVLDVEEGRVLLRYFDLPEGENSSLRREVVFQRASSIDDILDPTDDDGQPEYWIVRDANGLQVLVSVPSWSVHLVELSALAELVQPSVLVGIVAGAAGVAIAAVALFVPRRKSA